MNHKKLAIGLGSLLVVAAIISLYLTYAHYSNSTVVCPLSSSQDCNSVVQSRYGVILHLPVALIGLFVYLFLLWHTIKLYRHEETVAKYGKRMVWISGLGVIGAGYFNAIMMFKLKVLCVWCELNHLLMMVVFLVCLFTFYSWKMKWKIMTFVLLIGLGVATVLLPAATHDALAQCLTQNNLTMYGAYWCPHCMEQKQLFGNSFRYVNYVECAIAGQEGVQTQICQRMDIKGYPTWIKGTNRQSGVIPLQSLALWSGCEQTLKLP